MTWLEQNDESAWNVYYRHNASGNTPGHSCLIRQRHRRHGYRLDFGLLSGDGAGTDCCRHLDDRSGVVAIWHDALCAGDDNNEFTIGMILVIIVFVVLYKVIQIGSLPTTDITPFAA